MYYLQLFKQKLKKLNQNNYDCIGCSFLLKVDAEESIVNTPLITLDSKTQTTQTVRLDLNS
jgi:hypothetical protein